MPNYCDNYTTIKCTTTKLAKNLLKLLKDDSVFDSYLPSITRYSFLSDIDILNRLACSERYKDDIKEAIYKYNIKSVEKFFKEAYQCIGIINSHELQNLYYTTKIVKYNDIGDYDIDTTIKNISSHILEIKNSKTEDKQHKTDVLRIDRFIQPNILNEYRNGNLPNKFKYKTGIDYIDDAYNDFIEKVGTKWYPEIIYAERKKNVIHLHLQTAWGPCTGFFKYLSYLQSVKIVNDYIEESMCFCGSDEFNCGEHKNSICLDENDSISLYYKFLEMRDELNEFDIEYYSEYIIDEYNETNETDYEYENGIRDIGKKEINKFLKWYKLSDKIRKFVIEELEDAGYFKPKMIKIKRV